MTNQLKVTYIDHMGSDLSVVNSARVSFDKQVSKIEDRDAKLIKYLADHRHHSTFEHCQLSVLVECPLDIRSQIMRHRTFSYNEVSRRYTSEGIELFEEVEWRAQHQKSKQCSDGLLDDQGQLGARLVAQKAQEDALKAYDTLLQMGVAREQARRVLPIGLMTKFYMTGNLRNWAHFIKLRVDEHAQIEAQIIGNKVKGIILDKFPISGKHILGEL